MGMHGSAGLSRTRVARARRNPIEQGSFEHSRKGGKFIVLLVLQNPEEVFEATAQALLAGVGRDALAGWGAIVYVITPEGVSAKTLKGRMD